MPSSISPRHEDRTQRHERWKNGRTFTSKTPSGEWVGLRGASGTRSVGAFRDMARRRTIDRRRSLLTERLVRTLVIVGVPELVQALLLALHGLVGRPHCLRGKGGSATAVTSVG